MAAWLAPEKLPGASPWCLSVRRLGRGRPALARCIHEKNTRRKRKLASLSLACRAGQARAVSSRKVKLATCPAARKPENMPRRWADPFT